MDLNSILSAVGTVAETGTKAYSAVVGTQTDKLKEKAGIEQAKPAVVPPTATTVTNQTTSAWYKAKWVIPSAIGLVALVAAIFFFRRKR